MFCNYQELPDGFRCLERTVQIRLLPTTSNVGKHKICGNPSWSLNKSLHRFGCVYGNTSFYRVLVEAD